MSRPSSRMRPLARPVGTVSCMRLRQRRKVDFPHPDGPMIAVTRRSRRLSDTLRTARTVPYQALSSSTAMRGRAGASAMGRATILTSAVARPSVAAAGAEAGARRNAGEDTDDEDKGDENERSRPGEGVPLVIGADGVGEDL